MQPSLKSKIVEGTLKKMTAVVVFTGSEAISPRNSACISMDGGESYNF